MMKKKHQKARANDKDQQKKTQKKTNPAPNKKKRKTINAAS